MRGTVLGYDAGAGVSVVRGEDGQRYAFAPPAWREQRPPRKGDLVDFEARGDRAEMVFLLAPPKEATRAGPDSMPLIGLATRRPVLRSLLERPALIAGLLVLLACLTGVYRIGNDSISLYAVPDLIAGFARALDSIAAGSGTDPQPRIVVAVMRFVLLLLLFLYAVPVLTARAVWKEFAGRPAGAWGKWAGIAAMALPIVLPLLIIVPAHVALLPNVESSTLRLGGGGVEVPRQAFDVLRFYGTGTMLVFFSGLALWSSATGRFQPFRSDRREGGSSTGPVLRGGPASFGPPSVRKDDKADEQGEMVLPTVLRRRSRKEPREEAEAPAADLEAAQPAPQEWHDAAERPSRPAREVRDEARRPPPPPARPLHSENEFEEPSGLEGTYEPQEFGFEPEDAGAGPAPRSQEEPPEEPQPGFAFEHEPEPEPEEEPEPELRRSGAFAPQGRTEDPAADPGEAVYRAGDADTRPEPAQRGEARPPRRDWRPYDVEMEDPVLRRYVPELPGEDVAAGEETWETAEAQGEETSPRGPEPEARAEAPLEPEPEPEPEPRTEQRETRPEPSRPASRRAGRYPEPEAQDQGFPDRTADRPERQEAPAGERRGRGDLDDLSVLASDLRSALEQEIGRSSFSARRQESGSREDREPQRGPQGPAFSTRDTSFAGGEEEERTPPRRRREPSANEAREQAPAEPRQRPEGAPPRRPVRRDDADTPEDGR